MSEHEIQTLRDELARETREEIREIRTQDIPEILQRITSVETSARIWSAIVSLIVAGLVSLGFGFFHK